MLLGCYLDFTHSFFEVRLLCISSKSTGWRQYIFFCFSFTFTDFSLCISPYFVDILLLCADNSFLLSGF